MGDMSNAENFQNGDATGEASRAFFLPSFERHEFASEMSLRDIVVRVWRGKWIVALTMIAVVAVVTLWMKSKDPRYTATMIVAPSGDGGAGGLSGRLSQYSGIAALAGIDLPSNEVVTPFSQFSEIIASPIVAERLERKYDILPKVFADSWGWNPETKVWVRHSGLLTPIGNWVREFFGLPSRSPPSAYALSEYLQDKLGMSQIDNTSMQRIEFQHKDPVFAVQLLAALHKEADAVVREASEARTSRQIAYIERKLQTITAVDHRRSLVQLLLDQEKQMMMIQVDLPFAAQIIEPPISTDEPTFPRPKLFLAAAIVLGGMLGVMLVFLIDALRPPKRPDRRAASPAKKLPEDASTKTNGAAHPPPAAPEDAPSPPNATVTS